MTELHNHLLKISGELGKAVDLEKIDIKTAVNLNAMLGEAINFIPCCTELKSNEALPFEEWLSHFKKEDDCYWLNKETLYCKEAMQLHYNDLPDE